MCILLYINHFSGLLGPDNLKQPWGSYMTSVTSIAYVEISLSLSGLQNVQFIFCSEPAKY